MGDRCYVCGGLGSVVVGDEPQGRCDVCGGTGWCDPDPSTYSEAALRGLLDISECTADEWLAAIREGLVAWQTPSGATPVVTPRGHRLLAKAQVVADGPLGASLVSDRTQCINPLTDAGLLEWNTALVAAGRWRLTPWGRFVSALRERGRR